MTSCTSRCTRWAAGSVRAGRLPGPRWCAGWALELLPPPTPQLLAILTAAGCAMAAGWGLYAWRTNRDEAGGRAGLRGAYLPVRQADGG